MEEKKEEVKKVVAAGAPTGFIVLIVVILLIAGAFNKNKQPVQEVPVPVETVEKAATNESLPYTRLLSMPTGEKIAVRVADTAETRTLGLSGFSSLPANEGMLFVFPNQGSYPFWMKDMKISIDIIWMQTLGQGRYQVVGVAPWVTPGTYPEKILPNQTPADTVLEVTAGRASELGIMTGSIITY